MSKRSAFLTLLLISGLLVSGSKIVYAVDYYLEGPYTTSQYFAKAPTCTEAQAAFRAQARPEANATCGGSFLVAAFTIPPCEDWSYQDPANPYKVDGVAEFYCKVPINP